MSDSTLAEQQKLDPGIGYILDILKSETLKLDGTVESLGKNPISKDDAMVWGKRRIAGTMDKIGRTSDVQRKTESCSKNCKPSNPVTEVWQAVVRKPLCHEFLYQLLDAPTGEGHFAVEKTLARNKQRFW